MQLEYSMLKKTSIPFIKVGLRRVEDGKLAFLWVVNRSGVLKQAICLTDFGAHAIVKLEQGDTIFMLRTDLIVPGGVMFFAEGQNVRTMKDGKITGPEIAEWVPQAMIPLRIQQVIADWAAKKMLKGKYFVAPDDRWEHRSQDEGDRIVFSTEKEDVKPEPEMRTAIYGKKRRHF